MSSSARMLRLLSLLQTHRYWSGDELAQRLEVSPRTVRRDVERLRDLGYPVEASRGVDGGYQLQAGAALPPLLLEDEEAVAIVVSLQAGVGGAVTGIEESAVRALGKIVQVMPARLRRRIDALEQYTVPALISGPTVDATVLSTLAHACRDDERLEFDYLRADGESMGRIVEPHRLVSMGRRWYLVAYDLHRSDWRSFRVDRLTAPRATGMRFRQRELPAEDAAAFVQAGLDAVYSQHEVEVLVHAPVEHVASYAARWASVTPVGEASSRITMTVDTLDWLVLLLGSIGADFEVVRPPELTDRLRDAGELFTRSTARS